MRFGKISCVAYSCLLSVFYFHSLITVLSIMCLMIVTFHPAPSCLDPSFRMSKPNLSYRNDLYKGQNLCPQKTRNRYKVLWCSPNFCSRSWSYSLCSDALVWTYHGLLIEYGPICHIVKLSISMIRPFLLVNNSHITLYPQLEIIWKVSKSLRKYWGKYGQISFYIISSGHCIIVENIFLL